MTYNWEYLYVAWCKCLNPGTYIQVLKINQMNAVCTIMKNKNS